MRIKVTAPGGAYLRTAPQPDSIPLRPVPFGEYFEAEREGDFFSVTYKAYIPVLAVAPVADYLDISLIPYIPAENGGDGATECIRMLAQAKNIDCESDFGFTVHTLPETLAQTLTGIGIPAKSSYRRYPDTPFLALMRYDWLKGIQKKKSRDAWIVVLEIGRSTILCHDPLCLVVEDGDKDGRTMTYPLNDFYRSFSGYAVYLRPQVPAHPLGGSELLLSDPLQAATDLPPEAPI